MSTVRRRRRGRRERKGRGGGGYFLVLVDCATQPMVVTCMMGMAPTARVSDANTSVDEPAGSFFTCKKNE